MNGVNLDSGLDGLAGANASVMGRAFNSMGASFEDIMRSVDQLSAQGTITAGEALNMQAKFHHFTMYQELVTRVASKSANAINDVMKAQ